MTLAGTYRTSKSLKNLSPNTTVECKSATFYLDLTDKGGNNNNCLMIRSSKDTLVRNLVCVGNVPLGNPPQPGPTASGGCQTGGGRPLVGWTGLGVLGVLLTGLLLAGPRARARSRAGRGLVILLALFSARQASAKELLMFGPKELTYKASGKGSWEKWFANKIGKNWKSPVNYVDGQMHMRCLARELQRRTQLQVCIYWDGKKGNHSCAKSRVQLESKGDYAAVNSKPADWWGSKPQNWSNIGPKFRILLRDGLALSKIKAWKSYLPLKVNCTIVMVPVGETFSGWAKYPFPNMPGQPPRDGNLPPACYWGPCDASAGGPTDAGVKPGPDLGDRDQGEEEDQGDADHGGGTDLEPGVAPRDAAPPTPDQAAATGDSGPGAGSEARDDTGCVIGGAADGGVGRWGASLLLLALALAVRGARRRRWHHRPRRRPPPR